MNTPLPDRRRWTWLAAWLALAASAAAQDGRPRVEPCPELAPPDKPLTAIRLNIHLDNAPPDCARGLFHAEAAEGDRGWMLREFHWRPSELYHQPLYFEDGPLERYGQACHPLVQPWLSGAHFFGTFPIVPYKLGVDRTHDRVYALGYYRPGSPKPLIGRRLPREWDAAFFESGAWIALVFLLP